MEKLLFALLVFVPFAAQADCLLASNGQVYCGAGGCQQDNSGMVSCSIFKDGGAEVNGQGRVVCGKGECKAGSTGSVSPPAHDSLRRRRSGTTARTKHTGEVVIVPHGRSGRSLV